MLYRPRTPSSAAARGLHPVTLAMVAGLTVGLIDISLAIVARPPSLASFSNVFPPLAAASAITFVVTLLGILLVLPVRRLVATSDYAFAPAVATFIVVFFVVFDYGHTAPFVRNPFRLLIALTLAAVVGGMVLVRPGHSRRRTWMAVTLPFVLLTGMVFHWLFHYRAAAALSSRGVLIAACGVVTVAILCGLMARAYRARGRLIGGLFLAVLLSAGVTLWLERPHAYQSDGRHRVPHVILIVIDTLRADMLRCYNDGAPATPNIDAFASGCVRFDWAISPSPWTLPTMASIMTGLPATVHNAVTKSSRVPDGLITLAERMRDAGYVTGAVVDNPVLSPRHGMDAGFDSFTHFPRSARDTSIGTAILQRLIPERYREESTTDATIDLAIDWVERHASQDFFFWMHVMDPHAPYGPPARFQPAGTPPARIGRKFSDLKEIRLGLFRTTPEEDAWIRELYEGDVRYVDEAVGRFMEQLRDEGIYDDALIILTSDHGEEFREHGGVEHGHTLYDELLRVPLLVKLPGRRQGRVVEHVVSIQRMTATVLDTCDVDVANDPLVAGAGSLLAADPESNATVYSTAVLYHEPRESIILDGHKYIRGIESNAHELYDLENDPAEQNNIVDERRKTRIVARAREVLETHSAACARLREIYDTMEPSRFDLDQETIKRLKALGYL